MAAARKTGSDREAALRRVAIVLSSLPAPIASRLLGTVDSESKRQLRSTMSALADVDPMERRLALQAFKGSVQQHQPSLDESTRVSSATRGSNAEDEFVITNRDRPATQSEPISRVVSQSDLASSLSYQPPPSSAENVHPAPLAFLSDIDDQTLMSLLEGEHPQTIALVLASIAPTQAALVLPRLDTALRAEALSRIGRLEEIPAEAVSEIADHLKQRVRQQASQTTNSSGNRALNAILAAMPSTAKKQAATASRPAAPEPRSASEPIGFSSAAASPAIDQLHQSTGAGERWPDQPSSPTAEPDPALSATERSDRIDPSGDAHVGETRAEPTTSKEEKEEDVFDSTDAIHQHLISLSPSALCRALGKVETRVALLALCGLPNEVAESVLTILPRSHSKEVRRQLRSLGSLQLREIDQAKEDVARASTAPQTTSNSAPQAVMTRVPLAA